MARFHTTADGDIPFTEAEEIEADEREAEYINNLVPKAKQSKIAEVVRKYDIVKHNPVNYLNARFNGGIDTAQMAKSKADMIIRIGESNAGVQPFATTFNDINNNPVDLNTDQLQDLAVIIGSAYEDVYQKKARLKRDIGALTTVEEITAYDVDVEWDL